MASVPSFHMPDADTLGAITEQTVESHLLQILNTQCFPADCFLRKNLPGDWKDFVCGRILRADYIDHKLEYVIEMPTGSGIIHHQGAASRLWYAIYMAERNKVDPGSVNKRGAINAFADIHVHRKHLSSTTYSLGSIVPLALRKNPRVSDFLGWVQEHSYEDGRPKNLPYRYIDPQHPNLLQDQAPAAPGTIKQRQKRKVIPKEKEASPLLTTHMIEALNTFSTTMQQFLTLVVQAQPQVQEPPQPLLPMAKTLMDLQPILTPQPVEDKRHQTQAMPRRKNQAVLL